MTRKPNTKTSKTAPVRAGTNTKRKLIDAAHTLIWANSYTQVSVDDICREAGVRKGSFYHFFPSKSDLAAAALEDCWHECKDELDAFFAVKRDAKTQLKEICRLILDEQKESLASNGFVCGCPYALVAAEVAAGNTELHTRAEKMSELYCAYLERVLKNAAQNGLIEPKNLKRHAREMHTYIKGAMLFARLTNSLKPVGHELELALLRLSGIGTAKARTPRKR